MLKQLIDQLTALLVDVEKVPCPNGYTQKATLAHNVTLHLHHEYGDDTPGYREPSEDTFSIELNDTQRGHRALHTGEYTKDTLYPFKAEIHGSASMLYNNMEMTVDRPLCFDAWVATLQ